VERIPIDYLMLDSDFFSRGRIALMGIGKPQHDIRPTGDQNPPFEIHPSGRRSRRIPVIPRRHILKQLQTPINVDADFAYFLLKFFFLYQ
jgi:hypothetical protein